MYECFIFVVVSVFKEEEECFCLSESVSVLPFCVVVSVFHG